MIKLIGNGFAVFKLRRRFKWIVRVHWGKYYKYIKIGCESFSPREWAKVPKMLAKVKAHRGKGPIKQKIGLDIFLFDKRGMHRTSQVYRSDPARYTCLNDATDLTWAEIARIEKFRIDVAKAVKAQRVKEKTL